MEQGSFVSYDRAVTDGSNSSATSHENPDMVRARQEAADILGADRYGYYNPILQALGFAKTPEDLDALVTSLLS